MMDIAHFRFFGSKKKHIIQSENFIIEPKPNHWAWHLLLVLAALFVLVSQNINQEFVKNWLIAIIHSSGIKQKYLEMLKYGLLGLAAGCIVLWSIRKIITDDWRETVVRWRKLSRRVDASEVIPEVHSSWHKTILWVLLPIWTVGVTISLIPGYEGWADRLTVENGVFETLTVICYFFSSIVAFKLALPLFRSNAPKGFLRWWLLLLAIGCLFVASEETNWGDLYFHYKSFGFIRQVNAQHDISLHNIPLPFVGVYWENKMLLILAICGGVLLPILTWVSNLFRRCMMALKVPLPPWISQAYFFVAALIPSDQVIKLKRANIPSELREVIIAIGVVIWLWYTMKNRPKAVD